MVLQTTNLKDLLIIEPKVFEDARGYFFESYNYSDFEKQDITTRFVQDNQSKSGYGVIRGLHYQLQPKTQCKLIRVLRGRIYDVAVDIRKKSSTYGQWFGIELSDTNRMQLYIPKGFAHGFSVLSETAVILYKCDELYAPGSEAGIVFNDPSLAIDWQIDEKDVIVSEKDKNLPLFKDAINNF